MYLVAGDQGFLPAPVPVIRLSLAPCERREILIDMSKGKDVAFTEGEAAGLMARVLGFF